MEDGKEYKYREPTQKPINPPYKSALAIKRGEGNGNNDEEESCQTTIEDSICTLSLEKSPLDTDWSFWTNLGNKICVFVCHTTNMNDGTCGIYIISIE